MSFIEIETRTVKHKYNMSEFTSHNYYELYFLLDGKREIFIDNRMYQLKSNAFCIIPPFHLHKTEGDFYQRVNIYISQDLLSSEEIKFLQCSNDNFTYKLNNEQMTFLLPLLNTASRFSLQNKKDYLNAFVKVILYYLMSQKLENYEYDYSTNNKKTSNDTILKVITYINKNYNKNLTLDLLSKTFYLSINTLCKNFKKEMNTTINQYILLTRFNNAKIYLLQTNKSIESISELCGFSSANYFSLIFKKQYGISPANYRKKQ